MPGAGSERLERLLDWLAGLALEDVGIGNIGPYVPALRPSRLDAGDLTDDYWRRYGDQRLASRQAWHPGSVTANNVADVIARRERFEGSLPERWQPRRHPSLCMSAAAGRRLHARTDAETAEHFGLPVEPKSHARGSSRSRTVERMVERGDALWARAGGWPWAAFLDEAGKGAMPAAWWEDKRAESSLRTFLAEQAAAAQREAEVAANTARVLRWSLRGPG